MDVAKNAAAAGLVRDIGKGWKIDFKSKPKQGNKMLFITCKATGPTYLNLWKRDDKGYKGLFINYVLGVRKVAATIP